MNPDVLVTNHFTIFAFDLRTQRARDWVQENVQDDAQFFGGQLMVEHRFAQDLAAGMQADGLVVQ